MCSHKTAHFVFTALQAQERFESRGRSDSWAKWLPYAERDLLTSLLFLLFRLLSALSGTTPYRSRNEALLPEIQCSARGKLDIPDPAHAVKHRVQRVSGILHGAHSLACVERKKGGFATAAHLKSAAAHAIPQWKRFAEWCMFSSISSPP